MECSCHCAAAPQGTGGEVQGNGFEMIMKQNSQTKSYITMEILPFAV